MSPRGRTLTGLAVLVAAVALSVAALVADAARERAASPNAAVQQAVEHVAAALEPGDCVMVLPWWEERAWLGLGEAVEREDGDISALQRGEIPDPVELVRCERAWIVGAQGRRARLPEHVASVLGLDPAASPLESTEIGAGVSVALVRLPGSKPRATLTRDVAKLKVSRTGGRWKRTRCHWRGDRHVCGKEKHYDPHLETRDVFHRPVRWLYAHPGRKGTTLTVEWPGGVGPGYLVLRVGLDLQGVRKADGAAVDVDVFEGKRKLDTVTVAPNDYVLYTRTYDLGESTGRRGKGGGLRLELRTNENRFRQVMIQADVFDELPPGLRSGG